MAEPWLGSNRRLSLLGALIPLLTFSLGAALVFGGHWAGAVSWLGMALAMLSTVLLAGWLYLVLQPRLAYENEFLLVNLRPPSRPIRVPVESVECFFLGSGPSHLTGPGGRKLETINVIVRLAERAVQWQHVPVHPAFGQWSEGYITIRGAWCQPLNSDVVHELNQRLREVKHALALHERRSP